MAVHLFCVELSSFVVDIVIKNVAIKFQLCTQYSMTEMIVADKSRKIHWIKMQPKSVQTLIHIQKVD